MRVLQLVSATKPDADGRASVTGPERRVASIASRFPAEGVKPILVYPSRGLLWNEMKGARLSLVDYEPGGKFDLAAPFRIAQIARDARVDLVHSQGPGSLDAAACFAGAIAGKPVIVTRPVMIEDIVTASPARRRIYTLIDRAITMRMASRIVAVSEAGLEHLIAVSGAPHARVRLIHNGTQLSRYRARIHTQSHGLTEEPPIVIGMIGHLLSYKGWGDFLRVIARLKAAGLNIRGEIVGEGEERLKLEAMARELEIADRVSFLGYRTDIADVVQRFDIYLFTSHREGLSMAVIEAMASGLPIIASEAGGIREQVLEGENGYVLGVGDIEGLAQKTAALIADPTLRAKMGAASRKLAFERFDEERMLKEYAACYREAMRA